MTTLAAWIAWAPYSRKNAFPGHPLEDAAAAHDLFPWSLVNAPPFSRPSLLLALGLALTAPSPARAAAEPEPMDLVALHPCAVSGEKDKQKLADYQALCAAELAPSVPRPVAPEQVQAFLDKQPKKTCATAKQPAECLGRLAAATQASRAVLITLQPGALTRVSGLVVDAQGTVLDQKSIQIRSRGEPPAETLRTAFTRLRTQLALAPPRPAAPVEPPAPTPPPPEPPVATALPPSLTPPVVQQAPPPIATVETEAGPPRTWRTPAAYGAAGAGVVALGLAGYLAFAGERSMVESNDFYTNRLPGLEELPRIAELRRQANTQRTLAGVSAGVGAVPAGAGVYLWLWERQAPSTAGVTALSVGPGGVSLRGTLP